MSGRIRRLQTILLAVASAAGVGGCFVPGGGEGYARPDDGPGSEIWGSDQVGCASDADCASTEACIDQVCQIDRCGAGPYESISPIGSEHFFALDREVAVVDATAYQGSFYADGYAHDAAGTVGYATSWNVGTEPPVDVAGGNLKGSRPEETAVAIQGETRVSVLSEGTLDLVDVGFEPVAVAAGDVDADGQDELLALSASAEVAVCRLSTGACDYHHFGAGYAGDDLAAGDVDGDGLAEPVVLLSASGWSFVVAINAVPAPNEPGSFGGTANDTLFRVAAADLDGDGVDEAVALHDAGCNVFSCGNDAAIVYAMKDGFAERGRTVVGKKTLDLSASKLSVGENGRVLLLEEGRAVKILAGSGSQPLAIVQQGSLDVSALPTRIAAADFDGDSPSARLVSAPVAVPGPVVPTMAVQFPPYYRYRSEGVPFLYFGDSTNTGSTVTDTVSMRMGIDLAVEQGFLDVFNAKIEEGLSRAVSRSQARSTSYSVGARYALTPDPDLYGDRYGAVVVSYGCFHRYDYETLDPANKLGGSGHKMLVFVPVDGQVTLWSTHRYNAMAAAVGNLPTIPVPAVVGDPTSYPTTFKDLFGQGLSTDDLVFPSPGEYRVSDVGKVGFSLTVADSVTNAETMNLDVYLGGEIQVAGFAVGVNVGQNWGKGVSLAIGSDATFSGDAPAVPDDPETAGDEYAEYAYSFTPLVFRQRYLDAAGAERAYYALTFTAEY